MACSEKTAAILVKIRRVAVVTGGLATPRRQKGCQVHFALSFFPVGRRYLGILIAPLDEAHSAAGSDLPVRTVRAVGPKEMGAFSQGMGWSPWSQLPNWHQKFAS